MQLARAVAEGQNRNLPTPLVPTIHGEIADHMVVGSITALRK